MENLKIISEFERLVSFVQKELDDAKFSGDTKALTASTFRLRQIKNALSIIKKYPKKLNISSLTEFAEFPGIGKGTIDRIKEIIQTGRLVELKDFKDMKAEDKKALEELESIVGVGHTTALEFIKLGYKSVDELKKAIKNQDIEVNDKIELGIKYHGVFQGDIPRAEITKIHKLIGKIIHKLDKNYIFEICGSYRREKPTSGDIDILITKQGEINHHELNDIIKILKKPIKANDDKPLLVDDMTDNFETKYMGFSKYKDNHVRRIDIRFVPYDSYYSALLYFTGSKQLNVEMRKVAKSMNLKLSEYDMFKILEMKYLEPNQR